MADKHESKDEAKKQSPKSQPDSKKEPEQKKIKETEQPSQPEKPTKQPKKEKKQGKSDDKKETAKPAKKHGENFQYIVRLANTDIDGEKTVIYGLSQVKGIGRHIATTIVSTLGLDRKILFGDLSESQVQQIKEQIENIGQNMPAWMLNHQKEIDTGKNIHVIGTDVQMRLRDDINLMKMIRSYKGVRHEYGLPVRGQRTRANNRRGLALGVSKKKE